MTRYEKIKSLSLENMASFLSDIQWDSSEPSTSEMMQYLIEDYTDDENDVLFVATDGLRKQLDEPLAALSGLAAAEDGVVTNFSIVSVGL